MYVTGTTSSAMPASSRASQHSSTWSKVAMSAIEQPAARSGSTTCWSGGGEDVGGLGHEVHAAEDDVGGLRAGRRLLGELERVAGHVGELDDLVALVVVAEHEQPVAQGRLGGAGAFDQRRVGGGRQFAGAGDAAFAGRVGSAAEEVASVRVRCVTGGTPSNEAYRRSDDTAPWPRVGRGWSREWLYAARNTRTGSGNGQRAGGTLSQERKTPNSDGRQRGGRANRESAHDGFSRDLHPEGRHPHRRRGGEGQEPARAAGRGGPRAACAGPAGRLLGSDLPALLRRPRGRR